MTDPDSAVVAGAEQIVEHIALDADRIASRRRRFLLALWDLDLLAIVGRDWVRIGEGFEFHDLDGRAADRLTSALEDLAADRTSTEPPAGGGQLAFDLSATPPGRPRCRAWRVSG